MKVEFNRYTKEKLFNDIKKSVDKYEQMHNTKADAVRVGKVVLPDVSLPDGSVLSLNELVRQRGGKIIGTRGAEIVGFLYRHPKEGKYHIFLHIPKTPVDTITTVNSDVPFLVERGQKLHLTEIGLWED